MMHKEGHRQGKGESKIIASQAIHMEADDGSKWNWYVHNGSQLCKVQADSVNLAKCPAVLGDSAVQP